ncbi:hypothetical protein SBA2_270076 [Acidobacteriia bacterium SbA2]|nr:hypothetical protein SBA2_270076 [Acidobacteriia bacterium SbA2]
MTDRHFEFLRVYHLTSPGGYDSLSWWSYYRHIVSDERRGARESGGCRLWGNVGNYKK